MSFLTSATPKLAPWKILLVDDEPDIHDITKLTLSRFRLDGRGLTFVHAYSGAEAKQVLARESDIALVFLDVVMEKEDSGLEVARWMREELGNQFTRIVLRTGQPGQAPEERVIVNYDINDYKEKTELDRTKLFTTTFAALRAYRDIMKVEEARRQQLNYREGLERVIAASAHIFQQRNLKDFASGLLQQVVALLRLEQSMLLRLRAATAITGEQDYEILAQIGADAEPLLTPELLAQLKVAERNRISRILGDTYVGYFPNTSGKASLLVLKGVDEISEIDAKLLEVFCSGVAIAFDNILLNQEITDTQAELILRLGDVVESRSNEAGNHVRRMAEICQMLGQAGGLPDDETAVLTHAAPMHDIGKIATPDAVLLKPGKLDAAEWEIMKQHPAVGLSILDGSQRPILKAAAVIAHQHHEKYDGSGYPQGLKGEDIHLYARIVAVADVFDALMHKRCYKDAWPVEQVIGHLREVAGHHLDPKYVELLIQNIDRALAINERFPD
ncbi:HD domain-containing phosphohydrolase [Pseudoduganella violacea]|uniref:Response regulator RpfG family c-di-GMP phosphodiesterase n=1 Tax=Pseudoduganella violacea TaxID=1715466 RepID=A0A7W5FUW1_9BURK|nr:HD domain-containing phosphohydrolase [Pseudoduganella violacea]MBB3120335.1 response regulator RpfG family c-di-GMP phosphodiesterase [Pseudoduganella violacea]